MMEPRISFITLGVKDVGVAARFYQDVLGLPRKPMPEGAGVAFFEMGKTWLALYGREALAEDAGVPATPAGGFSGVTLAHNVKTPEMVDALLAHVAANGGRITRPGSKAFWGGYTGYFADPDGHLWEVAWNPDFPHV
jgi:uncharacterized protein